MLTYEHDALKKGFRRIAGIDEAGRGPLAGPVVAAAALLPFDDLRIEGINDSKQLSPKTRERLFEEIMSDTRILYGIGIVYPKEIDEINIYQATIRAMLKAVSQLKPQPDILLVDGLALPHTIPCLKIIKGDELSLSIAAASIIAKVTRDRLMQDIHHHYPDYGFDQHKGYGTAKHMEAIATHGPCEWHRMTFEPMKSQYS